MTRFSRD